MVVINLIGAPSSGKSTGCAYIFSQLKMLGYNVELVTEFAKDMVWEDNKEALRNQAYVFGHQFFRISRLEDKVDIVITDSPLILSVFYKRDNKLSNKFDETVMEVFNSYNNKNFFIERVKPYNPIGRLQNEKESDEIHDKLLEFLNTHDIDYYRIQGNEEGYNKIVDFIISEVGKK